MEFTYRAYDELISIMKHNDYHFMDYGNVDANRGVIIRHDVDYSLEKAIRIAELEQSGGVKSTFFLMLTCDFYNVFSLTGGRITERILTLGHDIGLHFDEMRYPSALGKKEEIIEKIILEADVLSKAIGKKVTKVSMHRPSRKIIDADLEIPGLINTYNSRYFRDYKYLSDSRRRWREPVLDIIRQNQFQRLQILVHPFWYNDKELSLEDSICDFVNSANYERYHRLTENFTNLSEVMPDKDVMGV